MTRQEAIDRIAALAEEQFARVAPFIEADLEVTSELADLQLEIAEGRRNALNEPLSVAEDVYARARSALNR